MRWRIPFNPTSDVRDQYGESIITDIQKSIDKSNERKARREEKKKIKKRKMNELIIFTTYDFFEADSIVAALQENNIPAYKRAHGAGSLMNITFGFNRTEPIDIIIPETAEDEAVDILTDMGLITR